MSDEQTKRIKKRQGSFLRRARSRAGLSVAEVSGRVGINIDLIEAGEGDLQMRSLAVLVRLYGISQHALGSWMCTLNRLVLTNP